MENKPINIIIVDDSPEFIEGLKLLLSVKSEFNIIGSLSNGKEVVESRDIFYADVLIMDIEMPIMNGFEAAKRIGFKFNNLPIIALTMYMDKIYLEDIISAGFKAFVYKPNVADDLIDVIFKVINNNYVFPDDIKISKQNRRKNS